MKKFTQILILSIFTILMIGGFAKSAFAAPLEVTFSPNPLFKEVNFAPGNQTTGIVEVSNNSGSSQNIIVEATNALDTGGLGNKLNLVITEGGATRYTGTLGQFLRAGEILLSPLANTSNTNYSFDVTFDSGADNNLQNKSLGFDLCVGFQGGATQCGLTVISGENGGGGAGVSGSVVLIISHEQALNITNVGNSGSVTITWDTNKLATSQVIYGLASGGPYDLNPAILPNLGYTLGSVEDGNKVMNHSVFLTNLIAGETYVYRVVSHASPATVSYEHQFTVPLPVKEGGLALNNTDNNNGQVLGAETVQPTAGVDNGSNNNTDTNTKNITNNNDNLLSASVGNIIGISNLWFWVLLTILLLIIIFIIRRSRQRKNK